MGWGMGWMDGASQLVRCAGVSGSERIRAVRSGRMGLLKCDERRGERRGERLGERRGERRGDAPAGHQHPIHVQKYHLHHVRALQFACTGRVARACML